YILEQNYPNPFNPQTTLPFSLDRAARVSLNIYDLHGRLLRSFGNAVFPAGRFIIEWDGCDAASQPMPSGVYFYVLELNGQRVAFQKMILIR
ncbi:MAG: T9SS C-terminal target domain-containing protein, partial [Calditrichaeota bacterium]